MFEVELLTPGSVGEAAQLLADNPDDAKLIGGGTALVLMLTQRLIAPRVLVALDRVPGLAGVTLEPGAGPRAGLRIGARTTHYEMETSPVVHQSIPALAETFHQVANVRVRHQATVGGVLAEADYASDPPAMLLALRARVRATSQRGERWIELTEFFRDFYQTALAPDEILTEVYVPQPRPATGAAYLKFNSRSSEDRPCVGVAAVFERDDGVCAGLRVVVGAVAGTPQEVPEAEALAAGQPMTDRLAEQIGRAYAEAINPLSDMRGSEWYRRQVIEVLVRRAILQAARS
jgi:carbon-monoxide dehydrogenase medium subunit